MNVRVILGTACLAAASAQVACDSDDTTSGGAGGRAATQASTSSQASSTTGGGGEGPVTFGACEGIAPGEAAAGSTFVGLSRAHASMRFFGDHQDVLAQDAVLVGALAAGGEDEAGILSAYVMSMQQGCVIEARSEAIPPARVDLVGEVAWIRFGAGDVVVPAGAKAVVIDLAGAVDGPTLDAFLERAAAATLQGDVEGLEARVRVHRGMRDEGYGPIRLGAENIYDDHITDTALPPIRGMAVAPPPLGVRLGARVAPTAARFALTLRARGRASLVEHGTTAMIAASRWVPVRAYGLVHRVASLSTAAGSLPDTVDADVTGDGEAALGLALIAAPAPQPLASTGTAASLVRLPNTDTLPPAAYDLATRRAALVVAHGATKTFFPYWSVVPDASDARLEEALAQAATDPDDAVSLRDELRFFSNTLHDSHGYVFTYPAIPEPSIPLFLVASDTGEPVVRVSGTPDVLAGDTIVAVDGTAVAEKMAELGERVSASTPSRFRNEAAALLQIAQPVTFTVRAPSGATRDVVFAASAPPPRFPTRTRGFLDDAGAPGLYYVNVDGGALELSEVADAITQIDASDGVVLDVRGYPYEAAWPILDHLLVRGSPGLAQRMEHVSVFARTWVDIDQPSPAATAPFTGKVALLVSPSTQSAAESYVLTLQAADRAYVVGQPSAGADGQVTSVLVPGAMALMFTGTEVRQPDLSPFHGIGCKVDEVVPIPASSLAAGEDPELEAAIAFLLAP